MKFVSGTIIQPGIDQKVQGEVLTSLGVVDQKTIWEINAIEVRYSTLPLAYQANTNIVADFVLSAKLDDTNFGDPAEIGRITWCAMLQQGGATPTNVKSHIVVDLLKSYQLYEPFQFANSKLFVTLTSNGTGVINQMQFKIFYNEKKVNEVDFYKLQSGYCVC